MLASDPSPDFPEFAQIYPLGEYGRMDDPNRKAREAYQAKRIAHWDEIARAPSGAFSAAGAYSRHLSEIHRFIVSPGRRVLELGCGKGDLLAALEPGEGVGVDFSPEMTEAAKERHPHLRFICGDAADAPQIVGTFDAIVLSDLVNDVWDVQAIFHRMRDWCGPRTRVVINSYSRVWQVPLGMARALRLAKPLLPQNWITPEDLTAMLELEGFEVLRRHREILFPLPVPLLSTLLNRYVGRFSLFNWAALTNVMVARYRESPLFEGDEPTVSVVVAARNERGNIPAILDRVPRMGGGTELIFVEGGSTDGTYEEIEHRIAARPDLDCRLFRQEGTGKGDAVRLGFHQARGDILMILDADLTVPPEDLPRFYEALVSGRGEFINGVRLVYPMEDRAMRFFNLVGNKFFSYAFSWLLGQPIRDTLCGTKVLTRNDYQVIAANRSYFGDFDPFGDFDLLFGAAKQNLKIVGLPIRYRERTYGDTNIDRWRHGTILLRMMLFASRRMKFT